VDSLHVYIYVIYAKFIGLIKCLSAGEKCSCTVLFVQNYVCKSYTVAQLAGITAETVATLADVQAKYVDVAVGDDRTAVVHNHHLSFRPKSALKISTLFCATTSVSTRELVTDLFCDQ